MRACRLVGLTSLGMVTVAVGQPSPPPVIDVHLHAAPVQLFAPPQPNCAHFENFSPRPAALPRDASRR